MKNIRVSEKTYNDLLELIVAKRRRGEHIRIGELTDNAMQTFVTQEMRRLKRGPSNDKNKACG
jgi:hypothetical protein